MEIAIRRVYFKEIDIKIVSSVTLNYFPVIFLNLPSNLNYWFDLKQQ